MAKVSNLLKENYFNPVDSLTWEDIPLADEPFVKVWEEYMEDSTKLGTLNVLQQKLVQLSFPVRKGMSANPEYLLATRRGVNPLMLKGAEGIKLADPLGFKVYLYQTFAGRIPVLETSNRQDFVTLVQALYYRNEPVDLPPSLGAFLIKGYNNWDRVARYKREKGAEFDFNEMKADRTSYQDSFLIVSDAEYSGIPAEMLGLKEEEWRRLSLIIRREHEATHYFTQRVLGSARNHPLDEFIADYMGIVAALGCYRADWFLAFMGLENYPQFRKDGRLTNYLGREQLTPKEFEQIMECIKRVAENIERYSENNGEVYSPQGKYQMLLRLSGSNLITLADDNWHK